MNEDNSRFMMPSTLRAFLSGALLAAPVAVAVAADLPAVPAPVVAATHSCAAAACPDKAAPFKSPNGMVVAPGLFDMGKMMDVEARKIQFALTNSNTMAVKVLRVRAGCSCTKVTDFPQAPIPPGGKVTVTLEVLGDKLPRGEFQRTAMVEFEGLTPPTVPLKYTGAKTQPIMVKPRPAVKIGKLAEPATMWTRTFEIMGNLENDLPLTLGVPLCAPPLKAELKAIKPSHYQLTVTQTGTRVWGTFRDRIRVPVTVPAGHDPILFTFSGQVGERLLTRPMLFYFPLATAGKPAAAMRRTIKISQGAKATRVVKAEDVKAKLPPGVKVVGVTQAGPRAAVELEFAPEFFSKERRENLFFSSPVGRAAAVVAVGGERPMSMRQSGDEAVAPAAAADDDAPAGDDKAAPAVAQPK